MRLSKKTIDVLKNFATINASIGVRAGSNLRTISAAKDTFAKVVVDDVFPEDFRIYDIVDWLSTLTLFDSPEIEFHENHMVIHNEANTMRSSYYYAAPALVTTPPDQDISFPSTDLELTIKNHDLNSILKASALMKLKSVALTHNGDGEIRFGVKGSGETANEFSVVCEGDTFGNTFNILLDPNRMNFLDGDYVVRVSKLGISCFSCEDNNAQYFIALADGSEWGGE